MGNFGFPILGTVGVGKSKLKPLAIRRVSMPFKDILLMSTVLAKKLGGLSKKSVL